ncbi:unnamed protein product [Rotaria sordida]|uniref:Uncharacterized protein n=1 Tax=Rotaria sordida TaxID=392033 RepID=A0A814RM01_9BILA|nr:unnamed protein product [Rotaria sordida]CAF1135082.1 unnamed protein product [Rotaria sordida]
MLRTTIVCLIALALQISALPKYIENLERDLASLPEEYQYLAKEINSKRAADNEGNTDAYCCKNWQHINNDEVVTGVQTSLVPQTHTVTIGYKDCHGNFNPTRPQIPIPDSSNRPTRNGTTPSTPLETTTLCLWTAVNKTETYMATQYTTVTYLVPNSHTYCAPEDYKCCPNYVMMNNNCVDQSVVANLEFLMQLGLISGVGKK